MNHALRNDPRTSPAVASIGVAKATRRHRSGTSLRAAMVDRPSEDFGLVCHDCSTVTIFSSGASHPLHCSRCGSGLRAPLAG